MIKVLDPFFLLWSWVKLEDDEDLEALKEMFLSEYEREREKAEGWRGSERMKVVIFVASKLLDICGG